MKRAIALVALLSVAGCATMTEQEKHNLAVLLGAAAVGVAAYQISRGGGGMYAPQSQDADWDAFYDNGQLVWVCRSISTGRWVPHDACFGLPQTDARWPTKQKW